MRRSSLSYYLWHSLRVMIFGSFLCLFMHMDSLFVNHSAAQSGLQAAPDFDVSSLDGEHFSNFTLEGERALLMFWAPWCGVCQRELPKLAQYYHDDIPNDLRLLTLGTSASREEVLTYVNEHSETFVFPTAHDANKTIAQDFGIRAFPTYILLDENGAIVLIHRGGGILTSRKFRQLTQ